ncbi:hypothetical protein ABK040_007941 [Willaertia magna]
MKKSPLLVKSKSTSTINNNSNNNNNLNNNNLNNSNNNKRNNDPSNNNQTKNNNNTITSLVKNNNNNNNNSLTTTTTNNNNNNNNNNKNKTTIKSRPSSPSSLTIINQNNSNNQNNSLIINSRINRHSLHHRSASTSSFSSSSTTTTTTTNNKSNQSSYYFNNGNDNSRPSTSFSYSTQVVPPSSPSNKSFISAESTTTSSMNTSILSSSLNNNTNNNNARNRSSSLKRNHTTNNILFKVPKVTFREDFNHHHSDDDFNNSDDNDSEESFSFAEDLFSIPLMDLSKFNHTSFPNRESNKDVDKDFNKDFNKKKSALKRRARSSPKIEMNNINGRKQYKYPTMITIGSPSTPSNKNDENKNGDHSNNNSIQLNKSLSPINSSPEDLLLEDNTLQKNNQLKNNSLNSLTTSLKEEENNKQMDKQMDSSKIDKNIKFSYETTDVLKDHILALPKIKRIKNTLQKNTLQKNNLRNQYLLKRNKNKITDTFYKAIEKTNKPFTNLGYDDYNSTYDCVINKSITINNLNKKEYKDEINKIINDKENKLIIKNANELIEKDIHFTPRSDIDSNTNNNTTQLIDLKLNTINGNDNTTINSNTNNKIKSIEGIILDKMSTSTNSSITQSMNQFGDKWAYFIGTEEEKIRDYQITNVQASGVIQDLKKSVDMIQRMTTTNTTQSSLDRYGNIRNIGNNNKNGNNQINKVMMDKLSIEVTKNIILNEQDLLKYPVSDDFIKEYQESLKQQLLIKEDDDDIDNLLKLYKKDINSLKGMKIGGRFLIENNQSQEQEPFNDLLDIGIITNNNRHHNNHHHHHHHHHKDIFVKEKKMRDNQKRLSERINEIKQFKWRARELENRVAIIKAEKLNKKNATKNSNQNIEDLNFIKKNKKSTSTIKETKEQFNKKQNEKRIEILKKSKELNEERRNEILQKIELKEKLIENFNLRTEQKNLLNLQNYWKSTTCSILFISKLKNKLFEKREFRTFEQKYLIAMNLMKNKLIPIIKQRRELKENRAIQIMKKRWLSIVINFRIRMKRRKIQLIQQFLIDLKESSTIVRAIKKYTESIRKCQKIVRHFLFRRRLHLFILHRQFLKVEKELVKVKYQEDYKEIKFKVLNVLKKLKESATFEEVTTATANRARNRLNRQQLNNNSNNNIRNSLEYDSFDTSNIKRSNLAINEAKKTLKTTQKLLLDELKEMKGKKLKGYNIEILLSNNKWIKGLDDFQYMIDIIEEDLIPESIVLNIGKLLRITIKNRCNKTRDDIRDRVIRRDLVERNRNLRLEHAEMELQRELNLNEKNEKRKRQFERLKKQKSFGIHHHFGNNYLNNMNDNDDDEEEERREKEEEEEITNKMLEIKQSFMKLFLPKHRMEILVRKGLEETELEERKKRTILIDDDEED